MLRAKRRTVPKNLLRTCQLRGYFTKGEEQAVMALSRDHGFNGNSDVLVKALGCLITSRYPDLMRFLSDPLDKA